jgi:hypothetical protein
MTTALAAERARHLRREHVQDIAINVAPADPLDVIGVQQEIGVCTAEIENFANMQLAASPDSL